MVESYEYATALKNPVGAIGKYIEQHVANLSLMTSTRQGYLVTSTEGRILLDLGITTRVIENKLFYIPTVFNIQLGDYSNRGHGPTIIGIWEKSFPGCSIFGADKVINPVFWRNVGYKPHDERFWLKIKG